ncbi:MAG: dUTP diphosphatase [Cetobacterium sp.]|uniref:dUTP diphosphatase n=1 Tax=Cetobacterium sp. TaxID=2071632 RepID=UPI003F384B9B
MGRPNDIFELLELQKELDKKAKTKRGNGFTPRKRDAFDLAMALDDEFNEFMKELPNQLNFKTWKDKEYDSHKQLIEYADCLFFILGAINDFHRQKEWLQYRCDLSLKELKPSIKPLDKHLLSGFKYAIQVANLEKDYDVIAIFDFYLEIGAAAGYTVKNLLDAYWEKWNINMGRDKKDWTLGGE